MPTCQNATEFLQSVFDGARLDLKVSGTETSDSCILNIEGEDSGYLLNEGGEFLDAVQHLTSQIFGREMPEGKRFVCDVEDFRATREAELAAMAKHAAAQVRKTGSVF